MIDVCLMLEGTYPYVAGGVSTWVHQLISSMKDIRFGIVSIFPHSDPTRDYKYEVPANVVYLKDVFLHDYHLEEESKRKYKKEDFETIRNFVLKLKDKEVSGFDDFISLFRGDASCFDIKNFFSSKDVWNLLTDFYDDLAPDYSFLDFFWTWRATQLPLMEVLRADIPKAKIYHSVSTGYAGLLAAMARRTYDSKFFLTEHGIYTHERFLEISQAKWIFEQEKKHFRAEKDLSFFKKWWVSLFRVMSLIAYHYADSIFTLYEGNKAKEISEGADADKIRIIPNGINIKNFHSIKKHKKEKFQVGLVGRVVNIKDIKTFIQAAQIVCQESDDFEFYIIGPTDEELDYYQDCVMMIQSFALENKISFTGRVNVFEYYSFLDLLVLTSISEAQPYVILEANVVGIPVVSSDVGACREMLEGSTEEDRLLGPSGIITEVANPRSTAEAIMKLAGDKSLYDSYSQTGIERVKTYYDEQDLLSRYLNLYEQNL